MKRWAIEEKRVLAIDPTSKGLGFVVLEGPARLVDWGVKQARQGRTRNCVKQADAMITRYQPDVLVVEDTAAPGSRRYPRVRKLLLNLRTLASKHKVRFRTISQQKVKKLFAVASAATKHQIAVAITDQFRELEPRLPPFRKPWMSEDERMAIFDAAAFALTFYEGLERSKPRQPSEV